MNQGLRVAQIDVLVFPPCLTAASNLIEGRKRTTICYISLSTNLALLGEVIFKVSFSDSTRQAMHIESVSRIYSIIPETSCEGSYQIKLE